ncbi:MAG: GNAT family N-acetyltransferase [Gammaproteobacteria bacterium]|nr:MAG: GNAT family N-acetyltransferase [Gammaproteobacteria bacterium]
MNAPTPEFRPLHGPEGPLWHAFVALYTASFPDWEREPPGQIASRLTSGRYRLMLALEGDRLLGFYLLDRVPELDHALLCFLAVAPERRGQGLGTALTRHCLAHYPEPSIHWLFIEAEEDPARLYGRLGARRLALEFRVPHFTDAGETPMHLMALRQPATPVQVGRDFLCPIIEHIFISGYGVDHDDPRLIRQCARVPERVRLEPWPARGNDHA